MTRSWVRWLVAFTLAGQGAAAAQTPAGNDTRPTVAVMDLSGGAIGRAGDFAALGSGIAELLATALADRADVRVVERTKLQDVLREQALSSSDRADMETTVRAGRALGAGHFILGGFVVEPNGRIRVDVRSINVETSLVEYRETVEGREDRVFDLVDALQRKLNAGLHLPPLRGQHADESRNVGKVDQSRAVTLYGAALRAADKHDTTAAVSAVKESLSLYPDFTRAKNLLAALEKRP